MTKVSTISILGCGWLGYPLAKELITQGHKVQGSTTSIDKMPVFKNVGIIPFQLTIDAVKTQKISVDEEFFEANLLVISLPPKIRKLGAGHGLGQMEKIIEATSNFSGNIIYTSSTSVYPLDGKSHDENSIINQPSDYSHPLLDIEKLLKNTFGGKLSILRLGGLFGYDRIPVKYFLKKREIQNGKFPVNYLHRDDAVKSVMTIIEKQAWGKIYNVVSPLHPTREAVFLGNAKVLNTMKPVFNQTVTGNFKIVKGDKIVRDLGFSYQFADPQNFTYDTQSLLR